MNPQSIYLRNCRTFDEISLRLPEGLLAILGENGAGKSTLISAIDVALFGSDGRSLAPWYPRGGGLDPLTIELVFEQAGEIYRVRRSFSPKGRGTSKCDLERALDADGPWESLTLESQTATQEHLEALIGLSRATFRASSYLAQGDAGAFCAATPAARKQILAEVVGLADWDNWLQRARKEKRESELAIAEYRGVLERVDEELAERGMITSERAAAASEEQAQRETLEKTRAGLTAARQWAFEVQTRVERRAAAERAQRAAQSAVAQLREAIGGREAEIDTLDARLADRDRLAEEADQLPGLEAEERELEAAARLWNERASLVAEADQLARQAEDRREEADRLDRQATAVLDGIGEEHCDRCGQVLGEDAARRAAGSYTAEARMRSEEASLLAAKKATLDASLAEMPSEPPDNARLFAVQSGISSAQEASRQLAALGEVEKRKNTAVEELDSMRAELPSRESGAASALADLEALGPLDPGDLARAQTEVRDLEEREQHASTSLEQTLKKISRCDERLERLARLEQDAAAKRKRIEDFVGILELRTAMERACSANGIPALILENIAIPQVEAEASRLLRVLGGPASAVELRTLRETKSAGIAETLDIVLATETGDANYEEFSGGEKARIAFALRLALAQLLSARKGADTGLLVIDEIDGLDAQGIAALVGVLEELQRNVPRIIVVSHQAELRDAFPQALMLENVDGQSRIVQQQMATSMKG